MLIFPARARQDSDEAAVGIGGQNEQQLLKIRAMVLRIAVRDRRRPLPGLTHPSVTVLTAESDRGAVMMQPLQLHGKALGRRERGSVYRWSARACRGAPRGPCLQGSD